MSKFKMCYSENLMDTMTCSNKNNVLKLCVQYGWPGDSPGHAQWSTKTVAKVHALYRNLLPAVASPLPPPSKWKSQIGESWHILGTERNASLQISLVPLLILTLLNIIHIVVLQARDSGFLEKSFDLFNFWFCLCFQCAEMVRVGFPVHIYRKNNERGICVVLLATSTAA